METVVYLAVFAFVASMAGPLMFDFIRANARVKRSTEHVIEMNWLNRMFRADLAKAREIVPEHADFVLGATTLILRAVPVGADGLALESKGEYVVYSVDQKHPSQLVRTASSWGDEGPRTTSRVVARDLEEVGFAYGPEDASEETVVELRMVFEKGVVHKNRPTFYRLVGWVGE